MPQPYRASPLPMKLPNPGHFLLGLLWIIVLGSSASAQDPAAVLPALRTLEAAVRETGRETGDTRNQAYQLRTLAAAYSSAGDNISALRALKDAETDLLASTSDAVEKRGALSNLAYSYNEFGDTDSILRLASQDPEAGWAIPALVRAHGKDRLLSELMQPRSAWAETTRDALAAFVDGVLERDGLDAAMQAADQLVELVATARREAEAAAKPLKGMAAMLMEQAWPMAPSFVLATLLHASVAVDRVGEVVTWAHQANWIGRDAFDRGVALAVARLEKQGNESGFEALAALVKNDKTRASMLGFTALRRLARGRVESGVRAAELFVADDNMLKEGSNLPAGDFGLCTNKRRAGFRLDRYYQYTSPDDFCSFTRTDMVTLALGGALARAHQDALAKVILDFSFRLGRIHGFPAIPSGTRPCPPGFPTYTLAEHYMKAGAKKAILDYAEHLAYSCPIEEGTALQIGRMLALLDSPSSVHRLLKAKAFTSPDAEQSLRLGLATALTEMGRADELALLLPTLKDPAVALYQIHLYLPDPGRAATRDKIAAALKVSLPLLQETYLTADKPEYVHEPRSAVWLLNYVRAGLGADVLPLIERLIDQTVDEINALPPEDDKSGYDRAKAASRLGLLFLAQLQADRPANPSSIANRLRNEHARDAFKALAAEALTMSGKIEAAHAVATSIPQPSSDDSDSDLRYARTPSRYGREVIGATLARAGDLPDAYKAFASYGGSIGYLIVAFRDGVAAR